MLQVQEEKSDYERINFLFQGENFSFVFRQASLKQESFYLNGQNNSKFSIIKNESVNTSTSGNKSTGKYQSGNLVLIPTNDDNETSQVSETIHLELK